MRKYSAGIILLVLAVASMWVVFNHSPKIQKTQDKLYHGKITIGMAIWPGYLALIIADEKGYFKDAGLDVEIKNYPNLHQLSKDYMDGKLQGRANLTLEAVNEHLKGLDHKVVLAIDYSNGSDAIMTTGDITSVKDFKGKRVGYEPGTLEEFFLVWALKENGLALSDIIPVFGSPEETPTLLKDGKVDVAVSYEPFISELSNEDYYKVYSSAQAPGLITDILTFRTNFIEVYPETVQAIVSAYFRAVEFWKANPQEANAIVAPRLGDTPEGFAKQLEGLIVLDKKDNESAFTFAAGFGSIYGNMRQIADFVDKQQTQNKGRRTLTDKLIDRRFVKKENEDN